MEESDVSYHLDNETQFWAELEDILSPSCGHDNTLIDNTLRSFLHFTSFFRDQYLQSPHEIAHCISHLLQAQVYKENTEYVTLQLVYSLLQEEEPAPLYIIASVLLFSGRQDEVTFEVMNEEGAFTRLVELIRMHEGEDNMGVDKTVHRLILELLYEMSRVQRLSPAHLSEVDDEFIIHLLTIIERLSDDVNDPYHYPVIRVILVLNEQYMVASTTPSTPSTPPPTNRVLKILSHHGPHYQTFGENLILLLNRETETSLQLLILKLLYLLFTTPLTHEYFYTNDLRVLLDVIIRNLLDLPNELIALRHTYLRVLYPLLAHTQLSHAPYYKRDEILRTLSLLSAGGSGHFESADETTLRLTERVTQVPWLRDADIPENIAKRLLGISLGAEEASTSVVDVTAVTAEPGVQTPSRKTLDQAPEMVRTDSELASDLEEEMPGGVEITLNSGGEVPMMDEDGSGAGREEEERDPMKRERRVPPMPPQPRSARKSCGALGVAERRVPPKTPPPRRRTRLKSGGMGE